MNEQKEHRQRILADLLRNDLPASQDELAERLSLLGYAVTQATISRDLEQIGAVKVRRNGRLGYALGANASDVPAPRLAGVFRDWVASIEPAGNLVVIKTSPGSAHIVGVALDQSDLAEVVGTICGDDTIFVACRSSAEADLLIARLRSATNLQ